LELKIKLVYLHRNKKLIMNMYAHKYQEPRSEYIKYRGNTGQIDVQSTIIVILAKKPGLRGVDIANLIYDKTFMPRSFGYVYEVLHQLTAEGVVARSGNLYYLLSDAVSHDMAVTADVVERLGKAGIDLTQARFLSSGLLMFAEQTKAEVKGNNYDIRETAAVNLASEPEPEVNESEESTTPELEVEEEVLATIPNPFDTDFDDEVRQELKEDVKFAFRDEDAAEAEAERKAKLKNVLADINTAQSLLGKTVEINPGRGEGQLIGTILELRPTGVTFLITFSTSPGIDEGTVLPYEYTSGLTYKIVIDPSEFE
jgi:hypothetical protein